MIALVRPSGLDRLCHPCHLEYLRDPFLLFRLSHLYHPQYLSLLYRPSRLFLPSHLHHLSDHSHQEFLRVLLCLESLLDLSHLESLLDLHRLSHHPRLCRLLYLSHHVRLSLLLLPYRLGTSASAANFFSFFSF